MSTLKNAIIDLLGWNDKSRRYNQIVNANKAIFSSFGKDIFASDIVKTAIYRVCGEVAKCSLKSVIERNNPRRVEVQNDSINAVFAGRVNPLCNLHDFLYKVAYLTLVNKNCFIYWAYDEIPIDGTKYVRRITRGFYPIENATVRLYMQGDEMRVELTNDRITLDMPYGDVIHIRHEYGQNEFLGGNRAGGGDYNGLLKNLQTLSVIKESIPKGMQAALSLKGVLTMKTVADADKQEVTREAFEQHLLNSDYGFVVTDYASDFTPINISATDIPQNVLSFIREEILSLFGVSLPIYLGKYTDEEYNAFYQTAVEPFLIEIAEAMKITLFTPREIAYGNKIKYYDRLVQSLSIARRQQIAEFTKDDALLNRSERRELLGYEPDDEPTRVSLNYIDVNIANQYQMSELAKGNKPTATPKEGNNGTNGK